MNINIDNVSSLIPGTRIECMTNKGEELIPEKIKFYGFSTNVFFVKSAANLEFHARTSSGPVVKISSTYFRQPQLTWIETEMVFDEADPTHICPEPQEVVPPAPVFKSEERPPVTGANFEEQLPLF